jgi:hypothetical protein
VDILNNKNKSHWAKVKMVPLSKDQLDKYRQRPPVVDGRGGRGRGGNIRRLVKPRDSPPLGSWRPISYLLFLLMGTFPYVIICNPRLVLNKGQPGDSEGLFIIVIIIIIIII